MQTPIDITFRDAPASPALTAYIDDWARKLEALFELQRCAVVVEKPHKHRQRGAAFTIHLDLRIPGHEVAVTRTASHTDPYLAVADAFRAARRQLIDFTSQRREARPAI